VSTLSDGELVERARSGDKDALSALLESLRTPLYRLATAMFWDRRDAEDATQEALIAVMTNLSAFRGDSSVSTWAHRIAIRLFARRRRSRTEQARLTFESFATDLVDGLAAADSTRPDAELLAQEVRVGCTLAVLQCLSREDRLVFALGDVFGLSGEDASAILEISHSAYRKRLSRVRAAVRSAVSVHCGIVNDAAACRCERRVDVAVLQKRIDPAAVRFVSKLERATREIGALHDVAALFRSTAEFDAPADLVAAVTSVLERTAPTLLAPDDACESQ
jgi:RNA polymerase sigma factor (sigma-70 family)